MLAWIRQDAVQCLLAVVSFATEPRRLRLPADLPASGHILVGTDASRPVTESTPEPVDLRGLTLAPAEALLVRL